MIKRFLSFILAVLIAAFTLTSCRGGEPDRADQTTGSTTNQQQNPMNPALDFADRLQIALL